MKLASLPRRMLLLLLIVAVLASVFLAYMRPEFIVDLANRYVFC